MVRNPFMLPTRIKIPLALALLMALGALRQPTNSPPNNTPNHHTYAVEKNLIAHIMRFGLWPVSTQLYHFFLSSYMPRPHMIVSLYTHHYCLETRLSNVRK